LITISGAIAFSHYCPRQKMNSAPEFVADDYDLAPNVRNDVVIRGSDIQVPQADRTADR
jgi:hypothetical protein